MNIQVNAKHYTNASEVIAAARERKQRIQDDSFFAKKYREEKARADDLQSQIDNAKSRRDAAEKAAKCAESRADFFEGQNIMLMDSIKRLMAAQDKRSVILLPAKSAEETQDAPEGVAIVTQIRSYIAKRARDFGFKYDDVVSERRAGPVVFVRHLIAWEIKKQVRPEISYFELGRHLGGRDHSSMIYAVNKIQAMKDAGEIE